MRYLCAVLKMSAVVGLVAVGALIVCSSAGTTAKETVPTVFARDGIALGGYDTVAYFLDHEPVPGSATHAVTWRGTEWHFTSAENARLFLDAPERFAPQYGGYSLYAMSRGKAYGADPRVFDIIDGKLYLSRNDAVREIWQRNPHGYIATADGYWQAASWSEAPNQLAR